MSGAPKGFHVRGRHLRAWVTLGTSDAIAIATVAARAGVSVSELLRTIVREWLAKQGGK